MIPLLSEVRTIEKEALDCISQIPEFGMLMDLRIAAKNALRTFNEQRGPVNIHLGFTLDIRLQGHKKKALSARRIDIGALVVGGDAGSVKHASYSLVICKSEKPESSPIVRKLHFDYEPIAFRSKDEPKPTVHMQVCGKFSEYHTNVGYKDSRLSALYPQFEKPRIPTQPTSLALLLNWLLFEFQSSTAAQGILRNTRWRSTVAKAERLILRPYFESACDFLKLTANEHKRFCQNHLYEASVD